MHIYLEATYNGQFHRLVSGYVLRMPGAQNEKYETGAAQAFRSRMVALMLIS